ncbi:MAG: DUF5106 domain-containing protein [Bacteroidaceae bacterium]|nr:DUF5106 domain-containing protein [Bacteroidaceae bacterium]
MNKAIYTILELLFCVLSVRAQEAAFPYPEIPDEVEEIEARMSYLLEHFWQDYVFADSTAMNREVGEQGMVDFLNFMQDADSVIAAQGARVLADSLEAHPSALTFFEGLMEHYLGDSDSPLYSDGVYAQLLRALPESPQRVWLLEQLAKNQVGSMAADILVTTPEGKQTRLYKIKAEQILLIFYDPDCRRCQRLDAQLKQEPLIVQNPRLKVVRKDINDLHGEYYVPHTPALYLLDKEKRVVLKEPNLESLLEVLRTLL